MVARNLPRATPQAEVPSLPLSRLLIRGAPASAQESGNGRGLLRCRKEVGRRRFCWRRTGMLVSGANRTSRGDGANQS